MRCLATLTHFDGRGKPWTQNATAMAVPRIIVAILENFQREDGTVEVPEVLR